MCTTLATPTQLETAHPTCLANAVHTTEKEDNCQNVIISTVDLELHRKKKTQNVDCLGIVAGGLLMGDDY